MIGEEDAELLQVMAPFSSRRMEGRAALWHDTQSSAGVPAPPSHWEWPGAPLSRGDTATLCCGGRESPGQLSFPLAFGDSVLGAIVGTVLGRAKSCFSVETVLLPLLLPLSWDEQDWLVEGAEGDTQQ